MLAVLWVSGSFCTAQETCLAKAWALGRLTDDTTLAPANWERPILAAERCALELEATWAVVGALHPVNAVEATILAVRAWGVAAFGDVLAVPTGERLPPTSRGPVGRGREIRIEGIRGSGGDEPRFSDLLTLFPRPIRVVATRPQGLRFKLGRVTLGSRSTRDSRGPLLLVPASRGSSTILRLANQHHIQNAAPFGRGTGRSLNAPG
mmetsp:Transcript_10325/g.33329  ORF Transcript_10325/g.33329 Transcript_10325/m.33329 type:complete len:207 (-) Transcript_10325:213-833(-)